MTVNIHVTEIGFFSCCHGVKYINCSIIKRRPTIIIACLFAIRIIVTSEMYIYMYFYSSLCVGISANTSIYHYNRKHK